MIGCCSVDSPTVDTGMKRAKGCLSFTKQCHNHDSDNYESQGTAAMANDSVVHCGLIEINALSIVAACRFSSFDVLKGIGDMFCCVGVWKHHFWPRPCKKGTVENKLIVHN